MTGWLRDVLYALRQMLKAPVFTCVAVLTLALSIGGTVTIFSFVDAILLKPLSYQSSGQLTVIWEHVRFLEHLVPYTGPNPKQVFAWREQQNSFSDIVLVREDATGVSLTGDHPRFTGRVLTEPRLLGMLGVRPALGRDFLPIDGTTGHTDGVIISHGLWQSLFDGAKDVLGRTFYIGPNAVQVIGVLPKGFYFPKANELSSAPMAQSAPGVDVLQPVVIHPEEYGWNERYGNYTALGRLKAGVTLDAAKAQLDAICNRIARDNAVGNHGFGPHADGAISVVPMPLKDAIVGKTRQPLVLLLAAVLSVLLIACVNLANAQLARAMQRDREAAVRVALGSTLWRLLRTSLVESLVLAISGGALGVWMAHAVISHYGEMVRHAVPRAENVALNGPVLAVAIACTVFATLACGLLPALRYRTVDPRASMQGSGRATGGATGAVLRRWLIALQMFACTALLLLTALFATNMLHLLQQDRGFNAGGTMLASVRMQGAAWTDERRAGFDDAVLDRLRSLPGVTHAAMVSSILQQGQTWLDGVERPDGGEKPVLAQYRWASPEYFETMGQRILDGRPIEARDRTAKVAVISAALAQAAWHGQSPLGRTFLRGDEEFTVVGVAADARSNSLRKTQESMVYLPYWDNAPYQSFFLVHGSRDLSQQADAIRNAIWSYDPAVTIDSISKLDSQVEDTVAPERIETTLLSGFAVLALLLAVLGIYGTLNYSVERRVQEFGIRMALGAGRANIYWTAMSEVALPVALGLGGGWILSLVAARALRSMLAGVTTFGAGSAMGVVILLAGAAFLAAWIPCHQAAQTEPMEALRTE